MSNFRGLTVLQTLVRWIYSEGLKERWVYRGMLNAEWFPTCEHYCTLLKNLNPIFPAIHNVYVSCSGEALNTENITDLVLSNGTIYNCSTNSSCMFHHTESFRALECAFALIQCFATLYITNILVPYSLSRSTAPIRSTFFNSSQMRSLAQEEECHQSRVLPLLRVRRRYRPRSLRQ